MKTEIKDIYQQQSIIYLSDILKHFHLQQLQIDVLKDQNKKLKDQLESIALLIDDIQDLTVDINDVKESLTDIIYDT